jgi:DnaD/phage-associated family protein
MSRKRSISTNISIDPGVNKLARDYGDFSALFYTWMIPHVEDNCEITGDPEELINIVCPSRRDKDINDIELAITGMINTGLVSLFIRKGKPILLLPPENFYKFQSYISVKNRDCRTADERMDNTTAVKHRKTPENTEERKETPENTTSLSPSLSLSPSPSPSKEDEEERARKDTAEEGKDEDDEAAGKVYQFFKKNIGMITPFQAEIIDQYISEGMSPEMIIAILQDSIGKDDKWSWIKKVLSNIMQLNIKTLDQYQAHKLEREQANAKSRDEPASGPGKGKPANMSNFDQPKYEKEYLDKLYKDV